MSTTNQPILDRAMPTTVGGFFFFITTAVIGRAGIVALVLGSVLAIANQADAIRGASAVQVLPLVLVYLTPFVVVTISQVLGIRRAYLDGHQGRLHGADRRTLFSIILSHGIPGRSLVLGLVVGSVNTTIALCLALLVGSDISAIPALPLVQAFVLPVLFGLISQGLSYRRAASTMGHRLRFATAPAVVS